jgi:hypothetical protein
MIFYYYGGETIGYVFADQGMRLEPRKIMEPELELL